MFSCRRFVILAVLLTTVAQSSTKKLKITYLGQFGRFNRQETVESNNWLGTYLCDYFGHTFVSGSTLFKRDTSKPNDLILVDRYDEINEIADSLSNPEIVFVQNSLLTCYLPGGNKYYCEIPFPLPFKVKDVFEKCIDLVNRPPAMSFSRPPPTPLAKDPNQWVYHINVSHTGNDPRTINDTDSFQPGEIIGLNFQMKATNIKEATSVNPVKKAESKPGRRLTTKRRRSTAKGGRND